MVNGAEEPKDYNNRWRFSKDIPISVVLFLIVQTVSVAMFLATQNAALVSVIDAVKKFADTSYTKNDAASDRALQAQVQQNATERYNEVLRRVIILESQSQGKR